MSSKEYNENIKALHVNYSTLADWIEKEKPVDWFNLIRSKNGDANATVRAGMEILPIYEMDNPRKVSRNLAKNSRLYNEEITVAIGMGLGHTVKAMLDKAEKDHIIIVVEPTGYILKQALSLYDFSKYILRRQLIFCITADDFSIISSLLSNEIVIQNWFMFCEMYTLRRELEYKTLMEQIAAMINNIRCNIGTIQGAGMEISLNDIKNLPYVIRHRGINELTDIFKDCPGMVISTGPSLQKNIHWLQKIQDKIIIVSTMQALRILLAYEITPDFVCTVDYGKVNMGHFRGLMNCNIPLIALNRTHAPILQEWAGPKFIIGTPMPGFDTSGLSVISNKGHVDQGGSVSHACLGSLIKMGCNPIGLLGQDLALGKTSHFKQADESGDIFVDEQGMIQWKVTDSKSHLYGGTYPMGPAVYTPGYYGGIVLTNLGLKSFITNFENIFRFHPDKKFINCTEGGAKIQYSKEMTLQHFIKKYCKKSIEKEKINPLLSLEENHGEIIKRTVPLLQEEIKLFDTIIENGEKALKTCDDIEVAGEDTEKLKTAMNKNSVYSKLAEEAAKKNPLIQMYIYRESVMIQGRDLKVKGSGKHLLKDEEDRNVRIERNRLIIKAAIKGSEELKREYEKTIELLQKYLQTKEESLLTNISKEKISLKETEKYFEEGNFSRPMVDALMVLQQGPAIFTRDKSHALTIIKKAKEIRDEIINKAKEEEIEERRQDLIQYCYCLEEGQKAGRNDKDFDKSLKLLRKAVKLFPKRWEARWGLATALTMLGRDKESLEQYTRLVENFPENIQFLFEKGLVQLRIDPKVGFEELKEVMSKTDKYDGFLIKMGDLYMTSKLYKEACTAYREYCKKFPADIDGLIRLEKSYEKLGEKKKASDTFKKIQQLRGRF